MKLAAPVVFRIINQVAEQELCLTKEFILLPFLWRQQSLEGTISKPLVYVLYSDVPNKSRTNNFRHFWVKEQITKGESTNPDEFTLQVNIVKKKE